MTVLPIKIILKLTINVIQRGKEKQSRVSLHKCVKVFAKRNDLRRKVSDAFSRKSTTPMLCTPRSSLDRLHTVARILNPGRIHHDSDPLADGLGGKVLGELGSDGAAASVGARHFTPDHPELVSLVVRAGDASGLLSLVNVGALLTEVELGVTTPSHTFHPEKGGVLVLTTEAPLVAGENGLDVEAAWRLDSTRPPRRHLFHGSVDFGNFRHFKKKVIENCLKIFKQIETTQL